VSHSSRRRSLDRSIEEEEEEEEKRSCCELEDLINDL
jgi:hypothetical protein